jgi:DNA-binding MarR family transcriptional regulator
MDDKQFAILVNKLETMSRLLALNVVSKKKSIEQVAILSSAGFMPKEIADMLGKTSHNVSVQLDRIKKRKKSGKPIVEERVDEADESAERRAERTDGGRSS